MRIATSILAASAFLAAVVAVRADEIKMTRDEALINAFQVMCFLGDPDFDRSDAKATAMRMQSLNDHPPAGPPGVTVKGHIWGGHLKTGPFALHLYEQRAKSGAASSCGVSGQILNTVAFRDSMLTVMKLKLPSPTPGPDSQSYIWNDLPSPNHRLILRTATTKTGAAQAMITYSVKTEH